MQQSCHLVDRKILFAKARIDDTVKTLDKQAVLLVAEHGRTNLLWLLAKLLTKNLTLVEQLQNASHEQLRAERLGNVSIGSRLCSFEHILVSTEGCEENDGDMTRLKTVLQTFSKLEAIHSRHHHVAYYQVDIQLLCHGNTRLAIRSHLQVETALQFREQELTYIVVVFYQKNGTTVERSRWCRRHSISCFFFLSVPLLCQIGLQDRAVLYQEVGSLVAVFLQRYRDHKDRTSALVLLISYLAMMRPHKFMGKMESYAKALARITALHESAEELFSLLLRNAHSRVSHTDGHHIREREAYRDGSLGRGVLEGVGQKIEHHLVYHLLVEEHRMCRLR